MVGGAANILERGVVYWLIMADGMASFLFVSRERSLRSVKLLMRKYTPQLSKAILSRNNHFTIASDLYNENVIPELIYTSMHTVDEPELIKVRPVNGDPVYCSAVGVCIYISWRYVCSDSGSVSANVNQNSSGTRSQQVSCSSGCHEEALTGE